MTEYCESCREAAVEEGADEDIIDVVLGELGEDIPDHNCDEVDAPDEHCNCACYGCNHGE